MTEEEVRFYESDSPCRKCGGCTRYRNTKLKGQCANCVSDKSKDNWAKSWVETTRRPDNTFRPAERGEGFQKEPKKR